MGKLADFLQMVPPRDRPFVRVMSYRRWLEVRRSGLVPHLGMRGMLASDLSEPRTYLFADEKTAEDAMANWLLDTDEYEHVRWFALVRVMIPSSVEVFDDPEIAGSFYVRASIPASQLSLIRRVDAGSA